MSMNSSVMRRVAKELKDLTTSPPEGIKVQANDADLTEVIAIISGPVDTPFAGGEFKVKLKLGADFPSAPPKGFFITRVFHPNVAPSTGEICVNTLKRDWKDSYGLSHILLTIKCLLMVPNAESSLNEEAGRLLLEQYEDYFNRAKSMTSIHAQPIKEKESEDKLEAGKNASEVENVEENEEKKPAEHGKEAKAHVKVVKPAAAAQQQQAKRGLKRL